MAGDSINPLSHFEFLGSAVAAYEDSPDLELMISAVTENIRREIDEQILHDLEVSMAVGSSINLPEKFPSLTDVAGLYVKLLNDPHPMLGDRSLKSLMPFTFDVSRMWLVGSQAWNLAIYGTPAKDRDFDIVFGDPGQAEEFIKNAFDVLSNSNLPEKYELTRNRHGGWKIRQAQPQIRPADPAEFFPGKHETYGTGGWGAIFDAWDLPEDCSIAEHIMSFSFDHERVAIMMGCGPEEPNAISRIVRPGKRNKSLEFPTGLLSPITPTSGGVPFGTYGS